MTGATLAACLKGAPGPVRAEIAVHIVCEIATALGSAHRHDGPKAGRPYVHGNINPETLLVLYDGGVALRPSTEAAISEAMRSKPAYLAPEQVSASNIDRRADIFALGVVLWELLTGTRLFERETPSETRIAVVNDPIRDVSDVNPKVPAALGQVLGAALERQPEARFDTIDAFGKALAGALASSGAAGVTDADVARWVHACVPLAPEAPSPLSSVPDLDVPGASRLHRSRPDMVAVMAPPVAAIPAFDVNAMAEEALRPSTRPPAISSPEPSARASSSPSSPYGGPSSGGGAGAGREITFDDDDDDMEIERNVASAPMQGPTSARVSGVGAPASAAPRVSGPGLELAQPSRMAREQTGRHYDESEPGIALKLVGALLMLAVAGGACFGLLRTIHQAGGRNVTLALPHAFDGTAATESGAVALAALVVAILLGFLGLRLKPHAWTIITSGGAFLLLALAMVTVTLASSGEDPAPPDGVLLVPYLFPAATLLLAIGLYARSARLLARSVGVRRAGAIPIAVIAGALAFIAFETSRFAH